MQLSFTLSPYPLEFQITLWEMAYGYCLEPLIPEDSILSTYFALNYLTEAESNKTSSTQKPATAGITAPTNSTVTSRLKPDPDVGTPTNSTVAPIASLKPYPDAGKLEVGLIVSLVVGILLALVLIAALFAYLYKKRARRTATEQQLPTQP
ncbi:uncharacterized protein LOC110058200 isoform X1 [Orbicella faveolata]|uniref:uncharacterized protein LOC110058200 isoform X1 n=1 Tax=Orbicella faveolata TaxID=48498 RepID=UPI0009E585D2|nr:uncharacterized protein LOC110058200 isoform X1 [Orbicella faveolata]